MRARGSLALLLVAACSQPGPGPTPDTEFLSDRRIAPVLANYEFSDPAAWTVSDAGHVASLELLAPSDYAPPFRSPVSIALIRDLEFNEFVFELEAMQTGREYGHRDLCLFFGFQSPSRYYYVHLATTPDANAHNVFLVDGAARRPLMPVQKKGIDWGSPTQWHKLRVERRLEDGQIAVYFDDMSQAVFVAYDSTLRQGRLGFGSFDDTGRFANVRVTAPAVRKLQGAPVLPAR